MKLDAKDRALSRYRASASLVRAQGQTATGPKHMLPLTAANDACSNRPGFWVMYSLRSAVEPGGPQIPLRLARAEPRSVRGTPPKVCTFGEGRPPRNAQVAKVGRVP